MSNHQNNIGKYHRNSLTDAERHALEKAALDDPFLTDALEGAELDPDFDETVKGLQLSLDKSSRTVFPWRNWAAIAAVVALFILAGVYFLNNEREPQPLASKETAPQEEVKTGADTLVEADSKKPFGISNGIAESAGPKKESKPEELQLATIESESTEQQAEAPISAREKDDSFQIADSNPASASESKAVEEKKEIAAKPIAASRSQRIMADSISNSKSKSSYVSTNSDKRVFANPEVITGKIIDSDGRGMPGVNVFFANSNTGTVTDSEGNFKLNKEAGPLQVTYIGMKSLEVEPGSRPMTLEMAEDISQLSEVVVTGTTDEEESEELIAPFIFATPEGGRRVFKQYLTQNLRYPREALLNSVEGRVTVQFTVTPTGELTDFKVVRGLGYGCDEELIRLIKQGPKWSPSQRDETFADKVKVRLKFVLPKKD